jgi:two-component system, chemotaxis family, chemotaxis protein CheY
MGMVLVIDDDDGVREAILDVLESSQVPARGVASGAEAFEYLGSNPPPRLILLDLVLPDMPGAAIRNRLLQKPELAGIPVVLMTASSNLEAIDGACPQLAGRLRKPFDLQALLGLVVPLVSDGH